MFRFTENTKIRSRILLLLVPLVVGVLFFSGLSMYQRFSAVKELDHLSEVVSLAPVINSLVHELQKERGISSVLKGTKNLEFGDKLRWQAHLTSMKMEDLKLTLARFEGQSLGHSTNNKFSMVLAYLARLDEVRVKIHAGEMTTTQIIDYYTNANSKLLHIIEEMVILGYNAEISRAMSAYISLMQAKEHAGLERAVGGVGFGLGDFSLEVREKFLRHIFAQNVFFQNFNIYAAQQQRQHLEKILEGTVAGEVKQMRQMANSNSAAQSTGTLDGTQWYETMTKKINLLKNLEDGVAKDLGKLTEDLRTNAYLSFTTFLFITLSLLAITGAAVALIVSSITHPITKLTGDMVALAQGRVDTDISSVQRGDEIGAMAKAVLIFKKNMIDIIELTNENETYQEHLEDLVTTKTKEIQRQKTDLEVALAKEKELAAMQRSFVSMASHEFRTPLTIIDGAAQRLNRRKDKMTAEEVVKRVEKIRGAVQRMTVLMESTLAAASADSGKIVLKTTDECNIAEVLSSCCERQREITKTHNIVCDIDELPDNILGDNAALDQVFTNLLSNAVKYAPDAPEIIVKGWSEGDDAFISIQDFGLGIGEEDLPGMFARFFRAKSSTGIAGTGIGLNLVKMFVEEHGGDVSVASELGKGSTFIVRLPIARQQKAAA